MNTGVDQTWKKRSMILGSWICIFKCSSKVWKNNGKFERPLRVYHPQRIIFQLRNFLKVWNSIMLVWKSVRKQNKLHILLTWYENTSQSQMTNNWIRLLKILPWSTRGKPKMFLNLANVPQDPEIPLLSMSGLDNNNASKPEVLDVILFSFVICHGFTRQL